MLLLYAPTRTLVYLMEVVLDVGLCTLGHAAMNAAYSGTWSGMPCAEQEAKLQQLPEQVLICWLTSISSLHCEVAC